MFVFGGGGGGGLKRPGRVADHPPLSSAEVVNGSEVRLPYAYTGWSWGDIFNIIICRNIL